ncbi:hypothetical protein HDU87_004913 [Geranomyces variabilis]|uniref:Uncharacterized protein n=1 Tax=Geranomyces variabilis TaxID=109894 RepID=A0AAD5XPH5_9FUNG|nr:hypothetical protein HDU87_004913 [Geranomyces variabilis]
MEPPTHNQHNQDDISHRVPLQPPQTPKLQPQRLSVDQHQPASRLSRASVASHKKKTWSTASSSGPNRYSLYQAIPGVTVRDFAYHVSDARHYGLPLAESSAMTSRSNSSDWFSSSEGEDDIKEEDEDDDSKSYGSGAERLFESDTDSDQHHGSAVAAAGGGASSNHPPHAGGRGSGSGKTKSPRRRAEIPPKEMETTVLPALAAQLSQHMGSVDLRFHYARAMFDFQKATEWEMSLTEGEDLVIATVGPPAELNTSADENASKDAQAADAADSAMTGVQDASASSENATSEQMGSSAFGKETREDTTPVAVNDESVTSTASKPGSPSGGLTGANERWASIDCVADELMTIVHGGTFRRPEDDGGTGPGSAGIKLSLNSDPPASDLAQQLNQLLDYAGVYGTGWATAVRFKCRGHLPGIEGQSGPVKSGGAGVRVKIRLVDMGLVPGNYIETAKVS